MQKRLLVCVLFLAFSAPALAAQKSTGSKDAGLGACELWCLDHNKTGPSQKDCVGNCIDYYCGKGKNCPRKPG